MGSDEKVAILMVDDQPAKLLSYEVILADLGQELIKASSASDALKVLLQKDVAVVLMDVSMPDIDGFELAHIIRSHPRFQKTAIVFISGVHLTESDKIQGYRSGAVDYISVPVVPEVLRAKISIFVELHRKTRMLERLNSDLERRVAERTEELRRSENGFRTRADLLELATEAIMVRDLAGSILFWNGGAERLYGWKSEEVLGQNMHCLLQTELPSNLEGMNEILLEKTSWQGNLLQRTRDGREIIVACHKTLNRDRTGILEVSRDITAQLQAEEALRETDKLAAMGRVAGIIAHEINNPLAAITNIFYILRNHPSLDNEARGLAALAEEEIHRVSHITRQTLSFYRESNQPVPVEIPELLDTVIEFQVRGQRAKHITVQRKYDSPVSVIGFPVEIRQIFLNLIGNAIQAMPAGGTLRLHVREATDWSGQRRGIAVSIIDTGVGIKPEDVRKLFQPFFTTKSTKGTGLGLWISKGIAQKYDGRITCRSLRFRERWTTCFTVFIPIKGIPNSSWSVRREQTGADGEQASRIADNIWAGSV